MRGIHTINALQPRYLRSIHLVHSIVNSYTSTTAMTTPRMHPIFSVAVGPHSDLLQNFPVGWELSLTTVLGT